MYDIQLSDIIILLQKFKMALAFGFKINHELL